MVDQLLIQRLLLTIELLYLQEIELRIQFSITLFGNEKKKKQERIINIFYFYSFSKHNTKE